MITDKKDERCQVDDMDDFEKRFTSDEVPPTETSMSLGRAAAQLIIATIMLGIALVILAGFIWIAKEIVTA